MGDGGKSWTQSETQDTRCRSDFVVCCWSVICSLAVCPRFRLFWHWWPDYSLRAALPSELHPSSMDFLPVSVSEWVILAISETTFPDIYGFSVHRFSPPEIPTFPSFPGHFRWPCGRILFWNRITIVVLVGCMQATSESKHCREQQFTLTR